MPDFIKFWDFTLWLLALLYCLLLTDVLVSLRGLFGLVV